MTKSKLTKQEFALILVNELKAYYKETADITTHDTMKTNGLVLMGICVRRNNSNIVPIIYIDNYYKEYLGGRLMDNILNEVIITCEEQPPADINIADIFTDFSKMKGNITFKLVNYEMNRHMLKETLHIRFLDLAIVLQLTVCKDDESISAVRLTEEHRKIWGVSLYELFNIAEDNTVRLFPHEVSAMDEILQEILHDEGNEFLAVPVENTDLLAHKMYILTNNERVNGAAAIIYDGVLRNIAENLNSDLVILPSSVHEVILFEYTYNVCAEELVRIVSEVNTMQVPDDEILSYNVYLYSRQTDEVSILK